jgi:hypothetical protein
MIPEQVSFAGFHAQADRLSDAPGSIRKLARLQFGFAGIVKTDTAPRSSHEPT